MLVLNAPVFHFTFKNTYDMLLFTKKRVFYDFFLIFLGVCALFSISPYPRACISIHDESGDDNYIHRSCHPYETIACS